MKIGILLHDLALGGVERGALRLGKAWASLRHQVCFYIDHMGGELRHLVTPDMHFATPEEPVHSGDQNLARLARWSASRSAGEIDLLFIPGNTYIPAIPYFRKIYGDRTRIVAKTSNVFGRTGRNMLVNSAFRALSGWRLDHADAIVAMSHSLGEECAGLPFLRKPISIIPQPTLDADFLSMPEIERVPSRICYIGRLEQQKNVTLLLHAFVDLADLDVELDIIGDGQQRLFLEGLSATLGISDRVHFRGFQTDTRPWLRQAQILVLPSDYEGYPAVLIEAAAAQTFVVARKCSPSISEIVEPGRTGLIVEDESKAALVEAIRRGLASKGDPTVMRALANRHLLDNVAIDYLHLFCSLRKN